MGKILSTHHARSTSGILLLTLNRVDLPAGQVNWSNYSLIQEGMSRQQVSRILGSTGWVCAYRPRAYDPSFPNHYRDIRGDEVVFFDNVPPGTPDVVVFVGFSNGQVVDKHFRRE